MPAYLASSERSSIPSRSRAVLAMRRMPVGACLIIFGAHCGSENRIDAQAEFRIDRHEIGAVEIRDRFHKRKVKPVPSAPTLGTGVADRVAEQFGLGDLPTGILFGMIIASLATGYFLPGLDAALGFWRSLSSPAARRDLGERRFHEHRQPGVCGLIFGCVVKAFTAFLRRVKTL